MEINLKADQLRVLDYWAQAEQSALVEIPRTIDQSQIEYWLPLEAYREALDARWQTSP
jgi:hypothetical protein